MRPSDTDLRALFSRARTIAIVGLSDKPDRDSNEIARYLASHGYQIVPVNPTAPAVLGERSYPSLRAIPAERPVDLAVVFRRREDVPGIARDAVARGIPVLWMQLGIESPEGAAIMRAAGGTAIEDACIMTQHRRLGLGALAPEG
ncbi:MAG TPA: CoA-binding protein [Thermoplasmata archaeon]|nr:CoA-binding protein [Thermoplasmata archaeon]